MDTNNYCMILGVMMDSKFNASLSLMLLALYCDDTSYSCLP